MVTRKTAIMVSLLVFVSVMVASVIAIPPKDSGNPNDWKCYNPNRPLMVVCIIGRPCGALVAEQAAKALTQKGWVCRYIGEKPEDPMPTV